MSSLLSCLGRGIFQIRQRAQKGAAEVALRGVSTMGLSDALEGFRAEQAGDLHAAVFAYQRAISAGGPEWATDRLIAVLIATGRQRAATELLENADHSPFDGLHYAAVLALMGDDAGACSAYEGAIGEVLHAEERSADGMSGPTAIQKAVDAGLNLLRDGEYEKARVALDDAARLVDTLLCGHVGWAVADQRLHERTSPHLTHSMVALVELDSALLRHRARAMLASNFADLLRDRELREDMAGAAMGTAQVIGLLSAQRLALAEIMPQHPNHAELHHRLGMLAFATGDTQGAIESWTKVLAIVPCHAPTAARLAAVLVAGGQTERAMQVLIAACAPSPEILGHCHRLSVAAANPEMLERTFEHATGKGDLRANIGYMLAALGLADARSLAWRNPFVAATTT